MGGKAACGGVMVLKMPGEDGQRRIQAVVRVGDSDKV